MGEKANNLIISILIFVFLIFFLFNCQDKKDEVERIIESGVEVVINHLEPYKIDGELASFSLEEEISIDTERLDLFEKGMGSAGEFNVDSEGNIYVIGFKNLEFFINKFDAKGNLVSSFGKRGQGPGEIDWPIGPDINEFDEISVTNNMSKQVIYDKNGNCILEIKFPVSILKLNMLKNGNYLVKWFKPDKINLKDSFFHLAICDNDFKLIKELDVDNNSYDNGKLVPYFMWRVSGDYIFVVNEQRGYEILVFDFEGNLVRKIRKEYKHISASEKLKETIIGLNYPNVKNQLEHYFPNPMPPINSFFSDENGRLFIMTYEKGEQPEEYIYDIFNPDGIFIGRKSLQMLWAGLYLGPMYSLVKNNKLYCYRMKESGYKELVVYRMKWE